MPLLTSSRDIYLWALFVLLGALSWLASTTAWRLGLSLDFTVLLLLAVLHLASGILIAVRAWFGWPTVTAVVAGLIAAQWHVLAALLAFFLWSINGFAP